MTEIPKLIGPPPPHVIETEVRGDISLYDAQHERVLVLNGTASDVWRLCDGDQTFDQIVALLARAYGVEGISDSRRRGANHQATGGRRVSRRAMKIRRKPG